MSNAFLRAIEPYAKSLGYRQAANSGKHLRWEHPNGPIVFTSRNTGNPHAIGNAKRDFRLALNMSGADIQSPRCTGATLRRQPLRIQQ